jgi:hypothetical protein
MEIDSIGKRLNEPLAGITVEGVKFWAGKDTV